MKRKILVIDDSKAIRFLLETVLGKSAHVTLAADASSGMYHLTKRNLPDLIIADPQLPDMHDWELIEYLASSYIYGHIPLMVLSSFNKQETSTKVMELGIKNHFLKPFNPLDLKKEVDSLFAYSNTSKEASMKVA